MGQSQMRQRRVDGGIAAKVVFDESGTCGAKVAEAYVSETNQFRERSEQQMNKVNEHDSF